MTTGLRPIGPRPADDLSRAVVEHLHGLAAALASPARRVRAGGDARRSTTCAWPRAGRRRPWRCGRRLSIPT